MLPTMAKRHLDETRGNEESERAAKKLRKEKRRQKATTDIETELDPKAPTVHSELSKAERKALRKASKQKQGEVANGTGENGIITPLESEPEPDAKEQRKALRRAEKALKQSAKVAQLSTPDDSSDLATSRGASTAVSARHTPDPIDDAAYREHAALTALAQTEIDTFVSEKSITIEDPLKRPLRPLITFKYLPIDDEAQRAPFEAFAAPTPIQAACWPYLLSRRDVVGVAETGSGKTLAFGLPGVRYISSLPKKQRMGIKACIVSPTRELAMQIYEQLSKLAGPAGLKATCVYGGVNKDQQRQELQGAQIVVATPGRLNDFIQEGSIDLSGVKYLVLDEADRMLDKGFEDEVRKIISTTPTKDRQTLMFTATWPPSVRELASTFMSTPVKVTIGDNASGELRANARIVQEVQVVEEHEKQGRLIDLLKRYQTGKNKNDRILVFCLYKKEATRIEEFIRRRGFNVAGIHGDLSQQKRTESLDAFKQGHVPLLVATDVAARGLDIPAVKMVINVTFPLTVEDYVHRIGRTGRAGQDGRAVTFFTTNEKALAGALINVLKAANQPVPEELLKFGTTVKKKGHDAYGAFFRDTSGMKEATKITFD